MMNLSELEFDIDAVVVSFVVCIMIKLKAVGKWK
jgi:hypothetical protein